MYSNSKAHIKLAGHLSNEIPILKGTEQGHPLSPDLFKLFFKDLSPLLESDNCPSIMESVISHLLWADDLVLLALDPTTLQNQLNNLSEYCKHWGVDINMDKTKLLIFNGTRSTTKNCQAKIDDLNIDNTKLQRVYSYCYLGIDISSTGSFKIALKNLKVKAVRALMSMKRTIDRSAISYKACCTLFDALIKPIILYAAPIWTPSLAVIKLMGKEQNWLSSLSTNSVPLDTKLASESLERVHLKFLKWALGVHSKATNVGVWGESGRTPLIYSCIKATLKYYHRLKNLDDNSLVSLAFQEQQLNNLDWGTNIKNIINNNVNVISTGNGPVLAPTSSTQRNHDINPKTISEIMINLVNKFIKCWENRKLTASKLSFYNKVKSNFNRESYLDDSNNFKARSSLTKLRISAHDLKIETGRYAQQPREARTCDWCYTVLQNNVVEDETHFLLNCDLYSDQRRCLIVPPYTNSRSETTANDTCPLKKFLPSDNNKSHNKLLCTTIRNMFTKRDKFIEEFKKANAM